MAARMMLSETDRIWNRPSALRSSVRKASPSLVAASGESMVTGFPKTREELFQYRGLILGSVEAGAFTGDQLRMIAEFVERRGGGLLMLGGPSAFAEGGYADTPVAEALPVVHHRFRGIVPAPAGITYNFVKWYVPAALQKHQIKP